MVQKNIVIFFFAGAVDCTPKASADAFWAHAAAAGGKYMVVQYEKGEEGTYHFQVCCGIFAIFCKYIHLHTGLSGVHPAQAACRLQESQQACALGRTHTYS